MDQEIQKQPTPWALKKEIGFFKALWETIKKVLFSPGEFFENLETEDSHWEPFSFYFIVFSTATIISLVWQALFQKSTNTLSVPVYILIVPLIGIIALYVGSAILHLFALLFGGKGGFKGTFNVFAYNASTTIFIVIPFIGGLIGGIWGMVVGVIGFKRIHKLSTVRAVFAYCGIPLIIAIIASMAAIAIPNLLRARITANESSAEATIKTVATAIEMYKTVNEQYPLDEYALTSAQPPYLNKTYNNSTINGYYYSLNFSKEGYEIVAEPVECAVTGNKIFKIKTDRIISAEECRRK